MCVTACAGKRQSRFYSRAPGIGGLLRAVRQCKEDNLRGTQPARLENNDYLSRGSKQGALYCVFISLHLTFILTAYNTNRN